MRVRVRAKVKVTVRVKEKRGGDKKEFAFLFTLEESDLSVKYKYYQRHQLKVVDMRILNCPNRQLPHCTSNARSTDIHALQNHIQLDENSHL